MSSAVDSNEAESSGAHGDHNAHRVGHIVPVPLLVGVLVALLFLTVVTVAVAQIDLGFLNIWIAMGIAVVKASLVCLFFMHLRWDRPFNSVLLLSAVFLLALFLSFCMMDTREYRVHLDETFVDEEQYLDKGVPDDPAR